MKIANLSDAQLAAIRRYLPDVARLTDRPASDSVEELRTRQQQIVASARSLLDTADRESRELTTSETLAHDAAITILQNLRTLEQREVDRERLAARANGNGRDVRVGDTAPMALADIAVPSRRSVVEHLQSRGELTASETTREVSFGAMLRAMVLGPRTEAERRALAEGTDSAGGYTVPDILSGQLIDRLRAVSTVIASGAVTVPLTSDKTTVARIATDPVATWRNENAAVNESDPTFDSVVFVPKVLAVLVKASRELLEDSVNMDRALETAFAKSLATKVDEVALRGSGSSPEPRGIANTSGVGSVSMGTNGAQLTNYDKLLDALQVLADANASAPTAAIMAPRTRTTISKLKDTTNQPLQRPDSLVNLAFRETTQLPVNETQGSASNASRIIVGNFVECLIGMRTQLRIEVLKERFADNLQYGFVAWLRADVQLAHAASFAQVVGIIP